jgi:hypothetical protein
MHTLPAHTKFVSSKEAHGLGFDSLHGGFYTHNPATGKMAFLGMPETAKGFWDLELLEGECATVCQMSTSEHSLETLWMALEGWTK